MRRSITDGIEEYIIVDGDAFVEFGHWDEAVRFLRGFLQEPEALDAMREATGDPSSSPGTQEGEDDLLTAFADLLVSGRVRMVHLGEALKAVTVLPPVEKPADEQASQPKSKPKPKEPQDAKDVDGQAQSDTLKRAAEDGKPFCEECEKAKQQQKQATGSSAA